MTTLENRPNTALLIIDMQNGVVSGVLRRDAVVANIGTLVDKARRERIPVIWVQDADEHHPRGSEAWQIVPELSPEEAEPRATKDAATAKTKRRTGIAPSVRVIE